MLPLPSAIIKLQVQYRLALNDATGGYTVAYDPTIFVVSLACPFVDRVVNAKSSGALCGFGTVGN